MKKYVATLFAAVIICLTLNAQTIVVHNDLLSQVGKNESVKTGLHTIYDTTLGKIKKAREKVTEAATAIEMVQQKVYDALTNVSDGVRNVRTLYYISQYTVSTLNNVSSAFMLAANKPYLIDIVSRDAVVFYERVNDLTMFVSDFVLKADDDLLVKPTERDRFLFQVYRQIQVLDAFSAMLCSNLKKWRMQDAVYNVIAFNHWKNRDMQVVNDILNTWKY